MEPQSAALRPPPGKVHYVFFNERGLRTGWRLVIFLALLGVLSRLAMAGFDLLTSAMRARRVAEATTTPLWLALTELAQFLPLAVSTGIMSVIERRPAGVYGLPLEKNAVWRFVGGYLMLGFMPLTAILLIMRGLGVFYFGGTSLHGTEIASFALAWGFMFLVVGLLEEYLFRGYALHTLAEGLGFWPAAVILAVAFAAVHMGNRGESRLGIADVFIFGVFAAATVRRTGNLWLAVGAHAGWDWGESFFYGLGNSGFQAPGHLLNPHIQGPDWLSGGSVGPEGSIVDVIVWALMTVGMLLFFPAQRQNSAPDSIDAPGTQL